MSANRQEVAMRVVPTPLPGVKLLKPACFADKRGHLVEIFHRERFQSLQIPTRFVQANLSFSKKNVLRGLHYQFPHAQGKLIGVSFGEIFDVAVDLRQNSPTFEKWFGAKLSHENSCQLYIPPGFAHGFLVLSEEAAVYYLCEEFYYPKEQWGICYNDPDLSIPWAADKPILSPRDSQFPKLSEIPADHLFPFTPAESSPSKEKS